MAATMVQDYIKEHLPELFETSLGDSTLEGCQKLSLSMLEEMGKAGVSKIEFNTLVWLACHQNKSGQVLCNVHMLIDGIGISDSYFPGILYKLRDKGLIRFQRTAAWREDKNGIYKVELPYNAFDGNCSQKKYIRLGHNLFRTKKFYALPPAGKYVLLMAAYELRRLSHDDIANKGKCVTALNYWKLYYDCCDWGGYSPRTVSEAFRLVKGLFQCKKKKHYDALKGKPYQAFIITLEKDDAVFACSDNYALYTNLLCGALEEEGSRLTRILKEQGDLEHIADLVIRHEGKSKEILNKARDDYKKGAMIQRGQALTRQGFGTKEEFADIRSFTGPFCAIVNKTIAPARRFGIPDGTGTVSRWDCRPAKSTVLKDGRLAMWFRYLASEAVSAFRWLSGIASYKKLDLSGIKIKNTVNEFMNMLLYEKVDSFGYVVKRIELRTEPAA